MDKIDKRLDPNFRGWFDTQYTEEVSISSGNEVDFDIEAAHICAIYRVRVTSAGGTSLVFKLYGKSAREDDDLIFSSGSKSSPYNSITEDQGQIMYVDEDGYDDIHCRIEGIDGETYTVIIDMVRQR